MWHSATEVWGFVAEHPKIICINTPMHCSLPIIARMSPRATRGFLRTMHSVRSSWPRALELKP